MNFSVSFRVSRAATSISITREGEPRTTAPFCCFPIYESLDCINHNHKQQP